jgi:predicted enzyme related to lactoylglutathione lyase
MKNVVIAFGLSMRNLFVAVFAIVFFGFGAALAADKGTAMTAPQSGAPIVFFDIAGPDAAKLKAFYASNFGWSIDAANLIKTPALDGTLRQDPPEKILYVGVTDLDAAMAKVKASGGEIVTPKITIPTGVFALFKDPAGNRMGLFQAAQ